ncbi:hypothetical protein EON63_03535 [archaeon]|nr:MAG: hypothetical protein EON63_03535 [archaeon]
MQARADAASWVRSLCSLYFDTMHQTPHQAFYAHHIHHVPYSIYHSLYPYTIHRHLLADGDWCPYCCEHPGCDAHGAWVMCIAIPWSRGRVVVMIIHIRIQYAQHIITNICVSVILNTHHTPYIIHHIPYIIYHASHNLSYTYIIYRHAS